MTTIFTNNHKTFSIRDILFDKELAQALSSNPGEADCLGDGISITIGIGGEPIVSSANDLPDKEVAGLSSEELEVMKDRYIHDLRCAHLRHEWLNPVRKAPASPSRNPKHIPWRKALTSWERREMEEAARAERKRQIEERKHSFVCFSAELVQTGSKVIALVSLAPSYKGYNGKVGLDKATSSNFHKKGDEKWVSKLLDRLFSEWNTKRKKAKLPIIKREDVAFMADVVQMLKGAESANL